MLREVFAFYEQLRQGFVPFAGGVAPSATMCGGSRHKTGTKLTDFSA